MVEGLVTVVVPVYNVEKYLNRCVESIIAQNYDKMEIILVDDGSPDNCPQMCDEWAKRDTRIKVIHKQNAGLGMARNSGIDAANGEYICFFDSDDYIDPELIDIVYRTARDNQAQSVIYGCKLIGEDGQVKSEYVPKGDTFLYEGEDIRNILLLEMIDSNPAEKRIKNIRMSAWSKLYSMKTITDTGWRFCSEREYLSEDLYSHLNWYAYVEKVVVIPKAFYNYCENSTSITKTYRKSAAYESEMCYDAMVKVCHKNNYNKQLVERLGFWYFGSVIGICKAAMNADLTKKEKIADYKKILYSEHFNTVMVQTDFRYESAKRKILHFVVKKRWYRVFYKLLYLQNYMKMK